MAVIDELNTGNYYDKEAGHMRPLILPGANTIVRIPHVFESTRFVSL